MMKIPLLSLILFILCNIHSTEQGKKNWKRLKRSSQHPALEIPLTGEDEDGYQMSVAIGTPPQILNLLVDTGSSNFAVACEAHPFINDFFHHKKSNTYKDLYKDVFVEYTQGSWSGHLGRDVVTLMSADFNVSITTDIACIQESENFYMNGSDWHGIIGLAFKDIIRPDTSVWPFMDDLAKQTDLGDHVTFDLCSDNEYDRKRLRGLMTLGGNISTKDWYLANLKQAWYYDVILTDISVNDISLDQDCKEYNFDKTIVDTGTSNMRLPSRVYSSLVSRFQDILKQKNIDVTDRFWTGEDVACWYSDASLMSDFPNISLSIASTSNMTFTLNVPPVQYLQLMPSDNDVNVFDTDRKFECYKWLVETSETGTVLGGVVLNSYKVLFDRDNKQVGFQMSSYCQDQHTQMPLSYQFYSGNTGDCGYNIPTHDKSSMHTASYVLITLCVLCLLPVLAVALMKNLKPCLKKCRDETPGGRHELLDDTHDTS